jgi:hypothetical protein
MSDKKKIEMGLGVVIVNCNPSTQRLRQEDGEFKARA